MSTHNMFSWRNKKTINTFGLKLEFRESDLFPQCFKLQLSDMKKEREKKNTGLSGDLTITPMQRY